MTLLLLVKPTTTCERKWRLNTHTMGSWGKSCSVFYLWLFNQWLFNWDKLFILFGMNSNMINGIYPVSIFFVILGFLKKSKLCKIIIIQWRTLSLQISLIYKKIYDLYGFYYSAFSFRNTLRNCMDIYEIEVIPNFHITISVWALHACWRFKEIIF